MSVRWVGGGLTWSILVVKQNDYNLPYVQDNASYNKLLSVLKENNAFQDGIPGTIMADFEKSLITAAANHMPWAKVIFFRIQYCMYVFAGTFFTAMHVMIRDATNSHLTNSSVFRSRDAIGIGSMQ